MGLYTKIIDLQKLNQAWEKVRKNKAAAGVDKMTVEDVDEKRSEILMQLYKDLKEGNYKPSPAKQVTISKDGKERVISVLCMRDKIVHQSVANELSKIYDYSLSKHSYAYRANHSALSAVRYLEEHIAKDTDNIWVLTADIEKFFDSIDRKFMISLLRRRIVEKETLDLIKLCINMPCINSQNESVDMKNGICQGSALAPVLSNIYLDDFDKFVEKRYSTFVRYSDDLIVFGTSREQLQEFVEEAKVFLGKRFLKLHEDKTKIRKLEEEVQFLGYSFNEHGKFIPVKASEKLNERLEVMWFDSNLTIQEKLKKGSEILLGWEQYYKDSQVQNIYEYVIICYQFQKTGRELKDEFVKMRFTFENIHKDITKYLVGFWFEMGRKDMALKEYEQFYQVFQADENEISWGNKVYLEELLGIYERLLIQMEAELMNELIQIYSDLKCYNKARRIASLVREEELKSHKYSFSTQNEFQKVDQSLINDKFELTAKEIEEYMELFVGRSDMYSLASIDENGRRTFDMVMLPLTEENVKKHLKGIETVATYIQRSNGSVKYMIFDVDVSKKILLEIHGNTVLLKQYLLKAKEVAYLILNELRKIGIVAYVEFSGGRGYHVWLFFEEWISTRYANLLQDIVAGKIVSNIPKEITIEYFPNKGRVKEKSFGQNIKLPWGLHYKTNNRTYFLNENGERLGNQKSMLDGVAKYSLQTVKRIISVNSSETMEHENKIIKYDVNELGDVPASIKAVVEQCGLMNYLCMKAKHTGYLTHFERLTLLYVFGHVGEEGKEFVHTIMSFTLNYQYSVTEKFIRKLPEKPISCNKLQEQYKQITAERGCNCKFVRTKNCYPSPVLHALRNQDGDFEEKESEITIPLVRKVSAEKKTKIYDELNVQKKIEEQAEKLIELKKQYRGIQKSVKKCEESLCSYFDDAQVDSIELDMGVLVREKTEHGYEWKIEI